jgi:hypothetical protein
MKQLIGLGGEAASNGQAVTSTILYNAELTTSLRQQGFGCPSQL